MIHKYYLSLNFLFAGIYHSYSKDFNKEHCKVFSNISFLGIISSLPVVAS